MVNFSTNNKVAPAPARQSSRDVHKEATNLVYQTRKGLLPENQYSSSFKNTKTQAMLFEERSRQMNPRAESRAEKYTEIAAVEGSPELSGVEDQARLLEIKAKYRRKSKWVLNPRSKFFRTWDMNTAVLLVYTAVVTPFEVGFLTTKLDGLFYFNRLVDLCFFMDLCFNLCMPFQENLAGSTVEVVDIRRIAARYMFRPPYWFFIDLISILPFDILTVTGDGATENLKVVRVIRLLRLAKLARILRAGRMFQRLESSIPVNYSVVSLCKFVVVTMFLAHWMACAWGLILDLQGDRALNLDEVTEDTPRTWVDNYSFIDENSSVTALYLASLYWSLATLSTVGYGDVVPVTDYERAFCICCTILGATVYAYTVGAVCSILAAMDISATAFYQAMDQLNAFISAENLDGELAIRLRMYFRFKYTQGGNDNVNDLLDNLSPALKQEVSVKLHAKWIHKVPFFENASDEFVTVVSSKLYSMHYPSLETIIKLNEAAENLYIVRKGIVVCKGVVLTSGTALGVDIIYNDFHRPYTAVCFSNCTVLILRKCDLQDVLDYFPLTAHQLRLAASRMMFRDTVLAYVRAVKATLLSNDQMSSVSSRQIDTLFSTDMLPLVYKHRLQIILQEDPDEMDRLNQATVKIQRQARAGIMRRRRRKILQSMPPDMVSSKKAGIKLLIRLELVNYIDLFKKEEILDIHDMAQLTPDSIARVTTLPLGKALLVVNEAKEAVIIRDTDIMRRAVEVLKV